jgi:hypothetical protein
MFTDSVSQGQSTLPSSCPVCEHSPLSADDCTPHKSLRTTIKVFLRTEEKKRESSRPKEPTPATPVQADRTPQLPTPNTEAPAAPAENAAELSKTDEKTETSAAPEGEHHSAGADLSAKDHPVTTEPVCLVYPLEYSYTPMLTRPLGSQDHRRNCRSLNCQRRRWTRRAQRGWWRAGRC